MAARSPRLHRQRRPRAETRAKPRVGPKARQRAPGDYVRVMHWNDEGIVLGVRRHGEASAILEVMTVAHGRHLGLVRGGAASRLRPVLQPGNAVGVEWRARLDEHLGHFTVEG